MVKKRRDDWAGKRRKADQISLMLDLPDGIKKTTTTLAPAWLDELDGACQRYDVSRDDIATGAYLNFRLPAARKLPGRIRKKVTILKNAEPLFDNLSDAICYRLLDLAKRERDSYSADLDTANRHLAKLQRRHPEIYKEVTHNRFAEKLKELVATSKRRKTHYK